MSLRKFCSQSAAPLLKDGEPNPLHCATSPRCEHHWFYDFRVNGRRHRSTTETADKQKAKDIAARERSRILEGRHGIRRQPDITFKAFAETYMEDHARPNKRSAARDEEIIKVLNRSFGSLILHEITAHRIEQFKRERLVGKWRGYQSKSAAKSLKPATVNRELDTLKSIFGKAVKWGKLLESPARNVERFRVENTRTRILSDPEQQALLAACPRKLRSVVILALVTGARIGELLALRWQDCEDGYLTFLETKNGKVKRIPISPTIQAVLDQQPKLKSSVFVSTRTGKPYTVNGTAHTFTRAVERAGILTGDVTLHTLRHTALSRMIAAGHDDYTVMAISGHSSTRMLSRYTHPTEERKIGALELPLVGRIWAERQTEGDATEAPPAEIAQMIEEILVDGRRIELLASALRTRRSPS